MITCLRPWIVVLFGVTALASTALAQQSKSAPLAKEVTELMAQRGLDSVAAKDPEEPDRFVAALFFGGRQLLVVAAKYSAPTLLIDKITSKQYRDVYIDLNSASIRETKVFVDDLSADGLRASRQGDQPFDSYESGAKRHSFDGDWRGQKMSEDDYLRAFTEADEQYARMLAVLLSELKKPS